MSEYKQLERKYKQLVNKVQKEVNNGNIYENQGQKEFRQFEDLLSASDLSYSEKWHLKESMITAIDNVKYFN